MGEEILRKNIDALKAHHPELAESVVALAAEADDLLLPSAPDADAAAETWLQKLLPMDEDILVFYGFGAGHKFVRLAERAAMKDKHIIIYEHNPAKFVAVMRMNDLSAALSPARTEIFLGENNAGAFIFDIRLRVTEWFMEHVVRMGENPSSMPMREIITESEYEHESKLYSAIQNEIAPKLSDLPELMDVFIQLRNNTSDLSEYLGEEPVALMEKMLLSTELLARDWGAFAPDSPESIHEWYGLTRFYLYELCIYHTCSPTYPVISSFVEQCCVERGGRMLDFGGGDGDMVLRLARRGFDIEYCDVPGRTMDFARWRFKKHGFDIPVIESTDPLTIELQCDYDVIIAMDVLEHLVNPLHYCEVFFNHLSHGGILLTRPSFSTDVLHPMHLQENVQFEDGFDDHMEKMGFRKSSQGTEDISEWIKS